MKYLRKHNVNPFNLLDDTILQKADGNIDLNPTQRVRINGDLEFAPGVAIPGPEVSNIIYVTQDGDDNNTGLGEGANQAKRTLKAALAVAQEGTTVYVRSGEYYEDNPLRVPPKVSIIGDSLRTTILRPLNGTLTFNITNVSRTDNIVTIDTLTSHGLVEGDRVRIKAEIGTPVTAGSFVIGTRYTITSAGDTVWTSIGSPSNIVGTTFFATGAGSGSGQAALAEVDETDVNVYEVTSSTQFTYRQSGSNIASIPSTGYVKKGNDFFLVNSASYIAQLVIKGLPAPAYCINIDSDAIVDTSPYVQNCSNINGPWLKNGVEWLPFQTEQPDLNGTMVSGPRPLRDDEIDPLQVDQYGVDVEGAGGGMLIDGDRYNSESPIKSMVADAFTQVCQGGVGFHISNFGYMQLVSCFAVFCSKAFYTTRGGYLSISNSVCDFGEFGFLADGYYPDPYATGLITSNYYSSVGSITVNTEGSGYTSAPTIIIDPPTIPGGVQAQAVASIDPILGIINAITVTDQGSGYDFQPSVTISPALGGATATANLAKNLTIDVSELSDKPQVGSVMFLGNDPVGYYVSATTNSNLTFKYNEQKCRRDVGIILNAVLSDAVFNSNHQTVYAGLSYLRSYSSKVTSSQKSQTIAGLQEAKTQAIALTSNITMQNRINANFNTVINIINLGISVAPSVSIPAQSVREPGFAEAAAILLANKTFIQDELEAWIAVNYPTLIYDVATCRRDIAYITDALAYDLTYEGNTQSVNAALAYAAGNVIAGQVEETQAAYEYWKTIVGSIVKNQTIVRSTGNTTTQNTSLSIGSPLDPNGPSTQAQSLLQIVIDVVDHGTGYIPDPVTQPNFAYGNDPLLIIERETVLDSSIAIQEAVINYLNSVYGGVVTVSTFPAIQNVEAGTEVNFHNVSTISTASTAMEYVGAGITYNALPFFGGEPIPVNERVEYNNGKCFTVTSDQVGNYRIGQYFNVNALTGEVTIDAENINLSGLAAIGPFKRNGIPVGVQLREVSNNSNLIASTGFADVNTVPTQPAVQTYVENRYLNKITTSATGIASSEVTFDGDIAVNGGDIYSTAITANLLNRDSSASIGEDGPTTVNAFLNAGIVNIAHTTSNTTINGNLEVKGSIVSTTQTTVNLLNTNTTTVNAFGDATTLIMGENTGSFTVNNSTINFPNATNVNIDGVNPTLASTSNGTLTLFDTLITTVNAFRTATSINIGESTGTITLRGANTVTDGDLQVKGGDLTTNQTTFNLLNTTATTVNAFGAATTVNIGGGSGLTTVTTNFKVNLDSTLGTDPTSSTTINGVYTNNLRDNTAAAVNITESSNSYIKIDTTNNLELVTFGSTPKVTFLNTTDATNSTTAGNTFAGGVGIAKKLYVGTDLSAAGSTTLGDDRNVDTHTISGVTSIDVPDNTAIAFQVKENTQTYITAVTTDNSESITIEATPKLLVKNTTDNTAGTAASGSAQFTGGVGIAKNLTVGVDLAVNRDITITGDLSVNGGDLTTTAGTFNLLNTTATTINFGGAATSMVVGATTGTTRVRNNLDVDGDVNIDGGDLTVSTATFNLANTTATTGNIFGAATAVNVGTSAASASTLTVGPSSSGNTLKVASSTSGTINYTTDVTSGTVNAWQSVTGTINIGASGSIVLGTASAATTTVQVGGAITGNTLKIASVAAGTANLTSDVTNGTVNVFADTTGTMNIGGQAVTVNLGTTNANSTLEVRGASAGTATIRTNSGVTTADVFNTVVTTGNLFGAGTTVNIGAATGTTYVKNNLDVALDVNIQGGDLTTNQATFNLLNTTATTVNAFGDATLISIGNNLGTTTINNANTVVTGDLAVNGGDITTSAATFNLLNTNVTTANLFGAATAIEIGAATGTTNVNNNLDVDGDVNIDGGDLTVSTATFNLANTTATTVNAFGAATTLEIGAATGTTNINNNLDVDGDVNIDGGDLTVSTSTFNLANTTATTVNAFGAATSLTLSATTGTTNIRNSLDVDGDINVDGSNITTSAGTLNLVNTTTTTVNFAGAATAINIGLASPTGETTIRHDLQVDGDLSVDGTLNLGNDVTIAGDLAVNGGDLTTTATTFNLLNATATTVNFAGAATDIQIGAATGTTNVNNNLDVDGDINFDGGDITSSAVTVNILAATSTTVNAFGAATALNLGAATGTTIVQNNLEVDLSATINGSLTVDVNATVTGNLAVNGGDITTSAATFNLVNANATTVNFAGAATTLEIGAATGTTNINNNLDVDGDVNIDGGDLTVSTATFNLANTTATTVNAFGAGTTISIGAATGTTNVKNNLDVDGDVNIDGGDLTVSTATFNLANTTATTGNLFGVATGVNVGISAASASTLTYGPAITGNTFKLAGTAVGTVNYTTDVTSGTVNAWQSVTGTVNLGKSGTINIGNSTTATTAAVVGGAITGNSLKIAGTAAGTVTLSSDVTTGSVNLFNNITTGTLNVAGAGASTINLGSTTSTVNIGVLTLATDLAVQYGGTGQSSFTTNGVIYGQNASGLAVTAASNPGSNAVTSYGVLTTDASNVPVWTDTIDGGSY